MNTLNPITPSNGMGGYPTTPPTTPPINPSTMPNQQYNQQQTQQQNREMMPQAQQPQSNVLPNQSIGNQAQPNRAMMPQAQQPQQTAPLNQPQQNRMTTNPQQSVQQNQPSRQPNTSPQANYQTNQGVQQQVGSQQMVRQPQPQLTNPMTQNNYNKQTMPVQQTQPMNQINHQQRNQPSNGQWQTGQHLSTGKQILRVDGNGSFVEVMDSKFQEGKVTFQFCNYDKTKPAGQRQTDFIRFNLEFSEFLNLGHQVLHENLMNRQPIDNYNNLRTAYMKGVPSKYNNGQAVARKLEIKNGDRQPIRLICSEGQGEETGPGLIKMVGQAQKRVQVAMSQDAFRSMFLVVPMYIQAYLNNHYDKCVK